MSRGVPEVRIVASVRYLLFGLVCVALVFAAFSFGGGGVDSKESFGPAREETGVAVPRVAKEAVARVQRLAAGLKPAARRFLRAFFRYEAGEIGDGVAAALRAASTPAFARELLEALPRSSIPGSFPPVARLGRLETFFISPQADRAVVNGEAMRGPAGEQFSFVFVSIDGRWLASGAGE